MNDKDINYRNSIYLHLIVYKQNKEKCSIKGCYSNKASPLDIFNNNMFVQVDIMMDYINSFRIYNNEFNRLIEDVELNIINEFV